MQSNFKSEEFNFCLVFLNDLHVIHVGEGFFVFQINGSEELETGQIFVRGGDV